MWNLNFSKRFRVVLVDITVCHCKLLHFGCHNSLSDPCWLGWSLDSWSDHAMLCADTAEFERFCAQFSGRKGRSTNPT